MNSKPDFPLDAFEYLLEACNAILPLVYTCFALLLQPRQYPSSKTAISFPIIRNIKVTK